MTRDGHLPDASGVCGGIMSAYGYALVSRSVRDVNPGSQESSSRSCDSTGCGARCSPRGGRAALRRGATAGHPLCVRSRPLPVCRRSFAPASAAGRAVGGRADALELAYGVRGKPALAGRFADSDLRFNLSHCDDVAVYALSYGRESASMSKPCG